VGPLAGLIAHGGVPGAVVESLLALTVVALFVAVWVRERHARRETRGSGRIGERRDDSRK
jgi:uncharacterized membrane protein